MKENSAQPPAPPKLKRRAILSRKQKLGLPVILAIPILALFGVFGETEASTQATSSSFLVTLSYPSRIHYRQSGELKVEVANRSARELDTVTVALDTAYASQFTDVRFRPEISSTYVVRLSALAPAGRQSVVAELTGDKYGSHPGRVTVRSGSDSATISFSTFVFP
jgi:hypothetical protein